MKITNKWTEPFPVEYGKDIKIRFSRDYFFVTIRITGDNGSLTRTTLGKAEQTIKFVEIKHIHNPTIAFCAETDEVIEAELIENN